MHSIKHRYFFSRVQLLRIVFFRSYYYKQYNNFFFRLFLDFLSCAESTCMQFALQTKLGKRKAELSRRMRLQLHTVVCFVPIRQQLPLSYFRTLQAYQLLSCKSPLNHSNHLLKPNIKKDQKYREEGQSEGVRVHFSFFRLECSSSSPTPSITLSTEFLTQGAFPVIIILEFTRTEKFGLP